LRKDFKATKEAHKFEFLENHIGFLELDNEICQQQHFQNPYVESQVPSLEDEERSEDSYSMLSSGFSFSEIFKETYENQKFEISCFETLDGGPIYDDYNEQMQENSEEEQDYLKCS
jgi:hypothetical protein